MATNDPFLDSVLDRLGELEGIRAEPMFGGHGLYRGERFFGVVYGAAIYFKVDPATLAEYESRGMRPFRPSSQITLNTFYQVPPDVLERREELLAWAERAAGETRSPPEGERRGGRDS